MRGQKKAFFLSHGFPKLTMYSFPNEKAERYKKAQKHKLKKKLLPFHA
jgi:hypothetical protein